MVGVFLLISLIATTVDTQGQSDCEGSCTIPVTELGSWTGWTGWSSDWNAAAADGDGFWLAFKGGISRWTPDAGVVERITAVEGLPHSNVYDIVMDSDGGFWISGDAGISHRDVD